MAGQRSVRVPDKDFTLMTGRGQMIAFQGDHGAYSEEAIFRFFGPGTEVLPCRSFEDVFSSVESGSATHGLVPIENSLAGSVHRIYDLLLRHKLSIVAETHLRIRHCLLALPGTSLEQVRRVISHPQALAQCERFLKRLENVEVEATYDTAGSAKALQMEGRSDTGAIAAARAAHVYQLDILAQGIEDNDSNYTRFLGLSPDPVQPENDAKTSIAFTLQNRPGVLHEALGFFAKQGIDLTKIESRPLVGKPWDYLFYLDFSGSTDEPTVSAALQELQSMAPLFRVLGSYPRDHWQEPLDAAASGRG